MDHKFPLSQLAHQFGWEKEIEEFRLHLLSLGIEVDGKKDSSYIHGFVRADGIRIFLRSIGWTHKMCDQALCQLDPDFYQFSGEERKAKIIEAARKKRTDKREREAEVVQVQNVTDQPAVAAAIPMVVEEQAKRARTAEEDNEGQGRLEAVLTGLMACQKQIVDMQSTLTGQLTAIVSSIQKK